MKLDKALLCPYMEYANSIWYPKINALTVIENVKCRITNYVPSLKTSHEKSLHKLKLPSLQYRQLREDMIETYKFLMGKYDKAVANILPKYQDNSTSLLTRGHSLKVILAKSREDPVTKFL